MDQIWVLLNSDIDHHNEVFVYFGLGIRVMLPSVLSNNSNDRQFLLPTFLRSFHDIEEIVQFDKQGLHHNLNLTKPSHPKWLRRMRVRNVRDPYLQFAI